MELVIHGTKGGYQVFTQGKLRGLLDVRADYVKGPTVGSEVYAIRFVENYTIYSKYRIVRDVRGDKRTGFLGFSLFVNNQEKLSGLSIKALLDEVSGGYLQRYIPKNDNNLGDVREDWAFLTPILNKYKSSLRSGAPDDTEKLQSSTKDDAFIYYKDDSELEKYFNDPFQEEYTPYRQVLFVKEELKGLPENPLNALRHSEDDLSGKIDLENPKYKLCFNQFTKDEIHIQVNVNGSPRSNNSKIRQKDRLEITWSKQHYESQAKSGKWNEIDNTYIEVDNTSKTVYIESIALAPKNKIIHIKPVDYKGNPVSNAEITCMNEGGSEKRLQGNTIEFKGEELGQHWWLTAKKGNGFYSEKKTINPPEEEDITIVLKERKKVIINVSDFETGDIINEYKVYISRKIDSKYAKDIEFVDEEIDRSWKIEVSHKEYKPIVEHYHPGTGENPLYIKLTKRQQDITIPIGTGSSGIDPNGNKPKPKSWFQKISENPTTMALLAMGILIIGSGLAFLVWHLISMDKTQSDNKIDQTQVEKYVAGTELNLDTLSRYRLEWKEQQPEIKKEGKSPLHIFGIDDSEEKSDSTEYKKWEETSKSIDDAITKRTYINEYNFKELQNLNYSTEQYTFKNAINKIDSTRNLDVKNKLVNISSLNLNQIATSINNTLSSLNKSSDTTVDIKESKEEEVTKKTDSPTSKESSKSSNSNLISETKTVERVTKPLEKEELNSNNITNELNGSAVSKAQLDKWHKDPEMSKNKSSIDLYLKFWELVNSSSNQKEDFDTLLKKVEQDKTLKNSELKKFLKRICKNSKEFENIFKSKIRIVNKPNNLTLEGLKKGLEM